jgi:hypothetical protein
VLSSTLDDRHSAAVNGRNPDGTGFLPPQVLIGVNDNISFYRATNLKGVPYLNQGNHYGGNNPRSHSETLLHELAHLLVQDRFMPLPIIDAFVSDSIMSQGQHYQVGQNHNRNLLDRKCGSIIRTFTP